MEKLQLLQEDQDDPTAVSYTHLKADTVEILDNPAAEAEGGAGLKAAQFVLDSGADTIITVRCGENAGNVFKAAEMKIYKSQVEDARDVYKRQELWLFAIFAASTEPLVKMFTYSGSALNANFFSALVVEVVSVPSKFTIDKSSFSKIDRTFLKK